MGLGRGGGHGDRAEAAAGFPGTALITEPTSDFVPGRWWVEARSKGGRFAPIVRARKLHKETIVSAKGKKKSRVEEEGRAGGYIF